MKKITLLTLTALSLAGCQNNSAWDFNDFTFIVPTGAPAVAMSAFSGYKNFETIVDPSKILPMMTAGTVDIAVLPTNVGANAIHTKKLPYKLVGIITFGNFYIASTGNDTDGKMDENDYIVSFQKGAVPDKIFHYVHGDSLDNALHYVSGAQEAAKCLKLGKNLADENKAVDYVVIAEPALTTVSSSTPNVKVYENLQESYKVKSGYKVYQACVVAKSSLDMKAVKEGITKEIERSVNEMLTTETAVLNNMNKIENPETIFGVKPELAQQLTINGNKLGIGFEKAEGNIEGINKFLSIFGQEGVTDEDITK